MRKIIAFLSLSLCLLFMCSCMRMETGVVINGDGTGRVFSELTIAESMLEDGEMTKEQFYESITDSEDNDKYNDWQKEEVERIVSGEASSEKYVGIRYYKDGKLDELIKSINEDSDDSEFTFDMRSEGGRKIVDIRFMNKADGSASGEISEYIAQGMMKVYFTVTAPSDVVETNGTVSADKRTVTWDVLSVMSGADKEKTLTVAYNDGSSIAPLLIIMIVGFLAAIIIVIITVVVSKNKKRSAGAAASEQTAVTSEKSETK